MDLPSGDIALQCPCRATSNRILGLDHFQARGRINLNGPLLQQRLLGAVATPTMTFMCGGFVHEGLIRPVENEVIARHKRSMASAT